MKKINFRKNHIIIPLFIFPFILAIYFIFFYDKEPTTTEATAQTQQAGLNTELPNAKDNIETPDRLEAYQEAVRKRRMNSGVNNLDETEKKTLEKEGQAQVDSLRKAFSAAEKTKLR